MFSRIYILVEVALAVHILTCQLHVAALPLLPPPAAFSESLDFQFLLNPEDAKIALAELDTRTELVQNRRFTLETQLKPVEDKWNSVDEADWKNLQGPIHLDPEADYAAVLAKFSKLRIERDEITQLKSKINATNHLAETIRNLKDLIQSGVDNYLHFSDIHPLMKSMLVTSQLSFDSMEDKGQFGSFCVTIQNPRKTTAALKPDFELKHICSALVTASGY